MISKLLFLQTQGIGDLILCTPVLQAIRRAHPEVSITVLVGSNAAAETLLGSSLCHDVIVVPAPRIHPLRALLTLLRIRRHRFDAALLATRLWPGFPLWLARILLGVPVIIGDASLVRTTGRAIDPKLHRVRSNQRVARLLFPDLPDAPISLPLDPPSVSLAAELWKKEGLEGRDVLGVHPGGDPWNPEKRVPVEKYEAVFRLLPLKFHIAIFLGPGDEAMVPFFSQVASRRPGVTLFLSLPLRLVAALVSRTRFFLANDSGLGHMAAALGVPVVTLAGPTQISSTRPWGSAHAVVTTADPPPCMPCYDTPLWRHCPYDIRCLRAISEARVAETLLRLPLRSDAASPPGSETSPSCAAGPPDRPASKAPGR